MEPDETIYDRLQSTAMELRGKLEANRKFLTTFLEPDFGLVDNLLARDVISWEENKKIKNSSDSFERNEKLLDFVLRKGIEKEFVESLKNTSQAHLANFINANGEYQLEYGDQWPLKDREVKILNMNQENLVNLLDTCDLLQRLFSRHVINSRQLDFISSKQTNYERNEALLDILRRRSLKDFRNTIECLILSNQSHVADVLDSGGVIVRIHTHLNGDNIDDLEEQIATSFATHLGDRSLSLAASNRILELTHLKIIAARRGQSVVLYVLCITLVELTSLRSRQSSGELNGVLKTLFNELLLLPKISSVTVEVAEEEIQKAVTFFNDTQSRSSSTNVSKDVQKKETPSPEKTSGIAKSKHEGDVSYDANPVLVQTLRTKASAEERKGISGVAFADGLLVITNFQTPFVEIYDAKTLTFKHTWRLHNLVNALDMAYCNTNKCFYIMDSKYIDYHTVIFRVDTNGKVINLLSTGKGYGCLSVAYDSNVLLASYNEQFVAEYLPGGQRLLFMDFSSKPDFAHPRHAIKLRNEQLLISFGEGEDPMNRVCIMDRSGGLLKSFGRERGSTHDRLFVPIFLTIDPNGKIIVADRGNSRILLLSADVEFERELIAGVNCGLSRPERMALDPSRGRLLVAHNDVQWKECRIFVFQFV